MTDLMNFRDFFIGNIFNDFSMILKHYIHQYKYEKCELIEEGVKLVLMQYKWNGI